MEENRKNIFAANYRWIAALPYPPRRWFTLRVRSGLGFTPFSKANQSFSSPHKHRKFRNGDRVVAAKFIRVHIRRRRRRYAAQYSAFRVITFRVRDGAFRNNVADRTAFFFFFFFLLPLSFPQCGYGIHAREYNRREEISRGSNILGNDCCEIELDRRKDIFNERINCVVWIWVVFFFYYNLIRAYFFKM